MRIKRLHHLFTLLATLAFLSADAAASAATAATDDTGVERTLYARWRGANAHIKSLPPALIEYLAANKANAIRILMELDIHDEAYAKELRTTKRKPKVPTPEDPLAPYELHLARLDSLIPLCRQHGIQIILTAGGVYGKSGKHDVFYETGRDDRDPHLIDFWRAMSKRYKNEPTIVAYGIKNEPNYRDPKLAKEIWWDWLLPETIKAIRENDKKAWLVVESPPNGSLAWGFAKIPTIDDKRVIYALHHYMPHAYTHQGVRAIQKRGPDTRGAYTYPGDSPRFDGGKMVTGWDKAAVERTMKEVFLFQKRNPGSRVLVSEFGVIRWAPGGAQWLTDSIEIFERHGWDWTFHSLAEWPGWDPTYEADAPIKRRPKFEEGIQETDRLKAVKAGWSLNTRDTSRASKP
ncbi:glycoside hydrolase family 5 protein [Geminisphaera colitermitum]|uniref:glycoside hydrolase family 5 protein n=1 Tax=Geminisphaera colitermitum TaxID=1148786 RepID=UPI000158D165|nr:cellulase family glycosylhydrolase [Geminisphaera colitermitum]